MHDQQWNGCPGGIEGGIPHLQTVPGRHIERYTRVLPPRRHIERYTRVLPPGRHRGRLCWVYTPGRHKGKLCWVYTPGRHKGRLCWVYHRVYLRRLCWVYHRVYLRCTMLGIPQGVHRVVYTQVYASLGLPERGTPWYICLLFSRL